MIETTIETLPKSKEYRIVEVILVSGKIYYEVQTLAFLTGWQYWKKAFGSDCLADARRAKEHLEGNEILSERVIE